MSITCLLSIAYVSFTDFLDANIPGMQWLNLPESLAQFSGTIASQTKLDIEGNIRLRMFQASYRYNFIPL